MVVVEGDIEPPSKQEGESTETDGGCKERPREEKRERGGRLSLSGFLRMLSARCGTQLLVMWERVGRSSRIHKEQDSRKKKKNCYHKDLCGCRERGLFRTLCWSCLMLAFLLAWGCSLEEVEKDKRKEGREDPIASAWTPLSACRVRRLSPARVLLP